MEAPDRSPTCVFQKTESCKRVANSVQTECRGRSNGVEQYGAVLPDGEDVPVGAAVSGRRDGTARRGVTMTARSTLKGRPIHWGHERSAWVYDDTGERAHPPEPTPRAPRPWEPYPDGYVDPTQVFTATDPLITRHLGSPTTEV